MQAMRAPPPRPVPRLILWGPKVVFYLLASMAIASIISVLAIPARAIDHDLARGLHDATSDNGETTGDDHPSGLSVLLTCRPLLIFAACAIMFHFANAAMLPLVGQKLALQDKNLGTSLMSACIVAAQIVMVPMAMLVGAKADAWGRKPLFLIALSVLTVRGCLYPFPTIPIGWSACNCWMASARASMARFFQSSSPI